MTDHEIPDEPGHHVLDEAALRTALAAVPDPPAGQLERAVQVALDAFDQAHHGRGDGPDTAMVPARVPRRGGAVWAHRRLAAVAAVVVALVGVAGILIAQDRPDSTPSDLAASPREASLEQPATTTTPAGGLGGAGTITAREQGEDDAATKDQRAGAAPTSAAPTAAQAAPSPPPQGSPSTPRDLGSYGDVASLLATVRAGSAAPRGSGGSGGESDSSSTAATDAAATSCGPPGSSRIGDATVRGTRMVVTLDGDPTDPAARLRVYVASGCAPVVDTPLGG